MNEQAHSLNPASEAWPSDTATSRRVTSEQRCTGVAAALVALPRWWFLGILVYAPWAYGCTRPWTTTVLNGLLGGCLLFWMIGCVAGRQRPRIPILLLAASAFLATQAAWMTFNAGHIFHPELNEFSARSQFMPGAAGSIDYARSAEISAGAALLLGALLFVVHCGRDPIWRKRLLFTMAAAATSLVLFGLAQRLLSAPSIFWGADDTGKTFFATYRYHSNAGAFINMIWPLVAAGFVVAVRRSPRLYTRLSCACALTLCLVALAVTGARAASVIALLFIGAAVVWAVRQLRRGELPFITTPVAVMGGILVLLIIVAAAAMAGLDVSVRRWNQLHELFSLQNSRLLVDGVCLKMIPDAGWLGFGPGTFRLAFPYYTNYLGDAVSGIWLQAHQDYLQTIIEWGWVGALAWALCVGGALMHACRWRTTSFSENTTRWAIAAAVLMTLLHALVDFPLQIVSLQLYFVTLLGLLWSLRLPKP